MRSSVFVAVWPLAIKEDGHVSGATFWIALTAKKNHRAHTRLCGSIIYSRNVDVDSRAHTRVHTHSSNHDLDREVAFDKASSKVHGTRCSRLVVILHGCFREEQIVGTQEKPQWIVAQRLLSHLQYLDATKSSAKDLSSAHFSIMFSW